MKYSYRCLLIACWWLILVNGRFSSNIGKLSGSFLTVLKKSNNEKHIKVKPKKIQRAVIEPAHIADDENAILLGKQKTFQIIQQLTLSIGSWYLSRVVSTLDFKQDNVLKLSRLVFGAYIIFVQLLYNYLTTVINSRNDISLVNTVEVKPNPLFATGGFSASSNTPPSKQKHSITARDYDLIEAKRALSSSLPAELIGVLFMHLVLHWNTPLLLAPLSLLGSKLQSPVVQINLLGLQAVGPLKRPFAGMMDALLASLNTETTPNPSAGDDATDSLTGSDVEQTEVDENETVDSADLEDTLSDETGRDKIIDDRERDVGDDEEDEEVRV